MVHGKSEVYGEKKWLTLQGPHEEYRLDNEAGIPCLKASRHLGKGIEGVREEKKKERGKERTYIYK